MRRYYLQSGLCMSVLTVLILGGLHVAAELNATTPPSNTLNIEGEFWSDMGTGFASDKISGRSTKIALGPNANATVSIDLIADSGAGNMMDEGVHSGMVAGMGTKIAVEVFAQGVTTPLVGARIEFDFKAEELKLDKVENSAFAFIIPEATGANLAGTAPVTLPESGFLGRAEFSTVADVTDKEFYLGIKSVTLAAGATPDLQDTITPEMMAMMSTINFNTASSPDFNGDGAVGFSDFLQFAGQFGARQGDGTYQARYDLDGNGAIDFSDFLIFANSFGTQVPPSEGFAPADQQAFNSLVVGKRIKAESYFLDFESAGRVREAFDRHPGSYTYSHTGANTGTLTQNYDAGLFGGRCTYKLTFTSTTTGTVSYTCANGITGGAERWQLSDLTTPIFAKANADTLFFAFLDTYSAGQTRAYDFQLRQKTPQGSWDVGCVTYPNESSNSVTTYALVWFSGLELNTTYEMRYRYRNSSSCNTGSPGSWSVIVEGATPETGSSSGGGGSGSGGNTGDVGTCRAGLVVCPEGNCVHPNGTRFSVDASGRGRFGGISAGTGISMRASNVTFIAERRPDNCWIIREVQ